jgi:hypothetical protein
VTAGRIVRQVSLTQRDEWESSHRTIDTKPNKRKTRATSTTAEQPSRDQRTDGATEPTGRASAAEPNTESAGAGSPNTSGNATLGPVPFTRRTLRRWQARFVEGDIEIVLPGARRGLPDSRPV